MSKGRYPYPEDEFDAVGDHDVPRGVHRAHRSGWRRAAPFLVVLVVFPLLAFGLVTWLSSEDGMPTISGLLGDDASDDASASVDPGAGQTPSATQEAPVETQEPVVQPTPILTTPVSVLNAARRSGLAAGAADTLTSAGFTTVDAGNGTAGDATATTVFYASEDLRDTADLVAQTLGITTVTLSPELAPDGVTVLLLPDFVA
ncbi:LytR C-terminal domain-containing protein [Cellulomonas hominis]